SMLLGYPVYENEYMNDVGVNTYPIAFGNWKRGYTIVDRSELRLLRDPYTKKGWIRFYFTKRVGGAPTDSNAIKLLKVAIN
ncbi:MAG: phage major capsid protein, partial [Mesorhizobium sp.]|nr:phage major capsid protein [Mesorhizobium sp.]